MLREIFFFLFTAAKIIIINVSTKKIPDFFFEKNRGLISVAAKLRIIFHIHIIYIAGTADIYN